MRVSELNKVVVDLEESLLLKELQEIHEYADSLAFTLNESEMLDEGAFLDWVGGQTEKVTTFFGDLKQQAKAFANPQVAENIGVQINKWSKRDKSDFVFATLNAFIEKLKGYIVTYPVLEMVLNTVIAALEKVKTGLKAIYDFAINKKGFVKFICATAFAGFISLVHEKVEQYANFMKGFVIDVKDAVVDFIKEKVRDFFDSFMSFEAIKEKLIRMLGITARGAGTISGLNSVVNFFNNFREVLAYVYSVIKSGVEKMTTGMAFVGAPS